MNTGTFNSPDFTGTTTTDELSRNDTGSTYGADDKRAGSRDPVRMVERMAQTAHQAVDRAAEKAVPAVQSLQSGVNRAGEVLSAQAERASQLQEQWMQSCRAGVRENPLTCVVGAMLAGWLLGRLGSR